MMAVRQADPQLVKFLLAHGADVSVRDREGWTSLMDAEPLDIEFPDEPPLELARRKAGSTAIKALLKKAGAKE